MASYNKETCATVLRGVTVSMTFHFSVSVRHWCQKIQSASSTSALEMFLKYSTIQGLTFLSQRKWYAILLFTLPERMSGPLRLKVSFIITIIIKDQLNSSASNQSFLSKHDFWRNLLLFHISSIQPYSSDMVQCLYIGQHRRYNIWE